MLIAIGVTPGDSGEDALALGGLLAQALSAEVLLVHVHPVGYHYPSPAHVDAEWEDYLREQARAILANAATTAPNYGIDDAKTYLYGHQSSGVGLIEAAEANGADLIVIGSAPGSSSGRFQIGSTADQLLHGSPVPVALAPDYYRGMLPEAIGRVVVAFQDTDESRASVQEGAKICEAANVPLTLLTILMRHRSYGSRLRTSGEDQVIAQLTEDAHTQQHAVLTQIPAEVVANAAVVIGDDAVSATRRYDWAGDELFVLSSAPRGVISRVFLGDMTYKLLRATPVPAIVLPRNTNL